jgi:hypothetical protein
LIGTALARRHMKVIGNEKAAVADHLHMPPG